MSTSKRRTKRSWEDIRGWGQAHLLYNAWDHLSHCLFLIFHLDGYAIEALCLTSGNLKRTSLDLLYFVWVLAFYLVEICHNGMLYLLVVGDSRDNLVVRFKYTAVPSYRVLCPAFSLLLLPVKPSQSGLSYPPIPPMSFTLSPWTESRRAQPIEAIAIETASPSWHNSLFCSNWRPCSEEIEMERCRDLRKAMFERIIMDLQIISRSISVLLETKRYKALSNSTDNQSMHLTSPRYRTHRSSSGLNK